MALTYLDFELEIGPNVDGTYPVAVIKSPAGETRTTLRWPFSELQLENRLKSGMGKSRPQYGWSYLSVGE